MADFMSLTDSPATQFTITDMGSSAALADIISGMVTLTDIPSAAMTVEDTPHG